MSDEAWSGEVSRQKRIYKNTVKMLDEQIQMMDQQREELLKVCELLISIDCETYPTPIMNLLKMRSVQDRARELIKIIIGEQK